MFSRLTIVLALGLLLAGVPVLAAEADEAPAQAGAAAAQAVAAKDAAPQDAAVKDETAAQEDNVLLHDDLSLAASGLSTGTTLDERFKDDTSLARLGVQALASLVVVLGVLIVTVFIARRFLKPGARTGAGGAVSVLQTTSLGPKKALHLVQVGGRTLLVAAAAEEIRLLADVTGDVTVAGDDDASPDGDAPRFTDALKQVIASKSRRS